MCEALPATDEPSQQSRATSNDMPKMKTHRGAAKRFNKTGTGKFTRSKAYKQHILTSKSTKRKRNMRGSVVVSSADLARLSRMLPNK